MYAIRSYYAGDHGSTFGGNPLACNVAYAVVSTIINDKLSENSERVGLYFTNSLKALMDKYEFIKEIRGKGLMIGIQFSKPIAKQINTKCFEHKYLFVV